uniref:Uncharacterized protein n=1 Tax=Solanum tuberosum TaxID=4113 RepID=M1BIS8_SOLTU
MNYAIVSLAKSWNRLSIIVTKSYSSTSANLKGSPFYNLVSSADIYGAPSAMCSLQLSPS